MNLIITALFIVGLYLLILGFKNHITSISITGRYSKYAANQFRIGLLLITIYIIFKNLQP